MFKKLLRIILKFPGRSLLILIAIVAILALSWLALSEEIEKEQEIVSTGQASPCKTEIVQPSCYQGSHPTPIFKWQGCHSGTQKKIRIQVDDFAYFNDAFPSPEFDSGEIDSLSSEYKLEIPALRFGERYYWGVTIYSDFGKAGGWWGWGDQNFTVAPACQN